jgi:hypothetical protein
MSGMKEKTLQEIHDEGIDALCKALGPVDMIRFIQMYDQGKGDYTKERKQWLSNDLYKTYIEIFEMQKLAETDSGSK